MEHMECWRTVDGYPCYAVSNEGRVKRLKSPNCRGYLIQERIMKLTADKLGYQYVVLRDSGKGKHSQVHRLVAAAFISNLENKPIVNHLDCNPGNNKLSNLEWCTHKENSQYAKSLGRCTAHHTKAIIQTDDAENIIDQFDSIHAAARTLGTTCGNISSACRTGRHAKGYRWKFVPQFIPYLGE